MLTRSIRLPVAVTRRFYVGIGLLIASMAIVGFWPTYFRPLLNGTVEKAPVIHFHATVYSGWLVLFIAQVVFASTGHLALHRKLGKVGIGYGVVIVIVGVFTALSVYASNVQAARLAGEQLPLAPIAPLSDMVVFSIFFGAAVLYRSKPEIHKRLMIVATTTLLIAAVGRMTFLGPPSVLNTPMPPPVFLIVWYLPILLAMGYDFITKRLIHPVYVIGLVGLFILRLRGYVGRTDSWADISSWMATFVS